MPTKKKRTCEHCSACTKVTRSKGDVFVCWGVSEPFEIEDITQKCKAYPWAWEDPTGHWKDETDSAKAEREAVEKQVEKKAKGLVGPRELPTELAQMGFSNMGEVIDFLRNSILLPHVEYDLTSINSCDAIIWYLDEYGFISKYEVEEGEAIDDAKKRCLEMSGKRFGPSENFIQRTESRIKELEEELEEEYEGHYEEMDSMTERIDELEEEVRKLTAAGAKDKACLEEEAEDWKNLVDVMKKRPEYKQFHDELEKEGFFSGTGLGTPDFGEVYKRYFAQKKTIEQYQKYAWELEKRLYEYEEKERKK